jgi:hypothetical protein
MKIYAGESYHDGEHNKVYVMEVGRNWVKFREISSWTFGAPNRVGRVWTMTLEKFEQKYPHVIEYAD